jgi:hypothetical protein
MNTDLWRVDVTDADIRLAKRAWTAARDGAASDAEVDRRYEDLRRLVSAQAQQIADDVRARRATPRRTSDAD